MIWNNNNKKCFQILDSLTLENLEVINNSNGEKHGTLLEKLDHCCTFTGKRLLRQWICTPLCSISGITSRQKAIIELSEKGVIKKIKSMLKGVPDLERLLGKLVFILL